MDEDISEEVKQIRADWLWTQDQVRRGNCPLMTFAQWWRALPIIDQRLFDPHLTVDECVEIRREEEAQAEAAQAAEAAEAADTAIAAERHERERREREQAARELELVPVVAALPPAPAPAAAAESPAAASPSEVKSVGSLCSQCKERLPKEAFTQAQLKKSAAVRRCKLCSSAPVPASADGSALPSRGDSMQEGQGRGGPKDEAEARRLYGLAAAQGDAEAQKSLAVMHAKGRGGPKDEAEARTVGPVAARSIVLLATKTRPARGFVGESWVCLADQFSFSLAPRATGRCKRRCVPVSVKKFVLGLPLYYSALRSGNRPVSPVSA